MAALDSLNDGQRAVLSLLLKQGRSYDDIATLLASDASGVRSRAHDAVALLGPDATTISPDRRREITDYLLGQQSASQRAATREYLSGSADGRAWGRGAAAALSEVAGAEVLPDVPAEREEVAEAFVALEKRAARQDEVRRSSKLGGKLIAAGLGIVIAIVILVAFQPFSGDDDAATTTSATAPTTTATATTADGNPTTPSGQEFQVIAQGDLKPAAGSGLKASGQVAIVRFPANNEYRLALQAKGLPPSSTRGSAYAVWFYSSPKTLRFVGFPDTVVGTDGKLETVADLDPKTPTYTKVLLTVEHSDKPKQPGTIVMSAPLLTAAPAPPPAPPGARTTTTP